MNKTKFIEALKFTGAVILPVLTLAITTTLAYFGEDGTLVNKETK
jgi:hypothetical protein